MNLLFTICGRAGSKGVKSKNCRDFLDIPIAYYTLAAYQEFLCEYRDEFDKISLALNTDSAILKEQFENTTVEYIDIVREENLCGDFVAKADVICDTLCKAEGKTGDSYQMIVDLDLTSPLRTAQDIWGCVEKLMSFPNANVCYSVTNSRRQPHFNLVLKDKDGYLQTAIPSHYSTRQEAPESYDMNASIYAYRRNPLLNTREEDVFDGKCVGWLMKDTAVLDIDSEEDYELMQILARYFFEHDEKLHRIYQAAKCFTYNKRM